MAIKYVRECHQLYITMPLTFVSKQITLRLYCVPDSQLLQVLCKMTHEHLLYV